MSPMDSPHKGTEFSCLDIIVYYARNETKCYASKFSSISGYGIDLVLTEYSGLS